MESIFNNTLDQTFLNTKWYFWKMEFNHSISFFGKEILWQKTIKKRSHFSGSRAVQRLN